MSILNINVNDLFLDMQLSVFQFSVEGGDPIQTPIQTAQNICLVCKQWKDVTYQNLLPLYWNRLNGFIKALASYQNGIELLANASVDYEGLISFKRLSKALGSSSLMLLPCDYERFIDCQLEKMWIRIRNKVGFESDNGPKSASEIRAWLKDPNNILLIQTVTILNLSGLQLTHLPPEIAYFTNLEELRLSRNELKAVPAEIGNLANLQILYLDRNQFTSLPAEIGNLINLQRLDLENNQLAALPTEIGNLINLQRLDLDANKLVELPAEIGNLVNLRQLGLNKNQLAILPPQIGDLANLEELYLRQNQLTALPAEIGNLANLVWLYLNHNQLTALPDEIGNLANLEEVFLEYNQLTALPAKIGRLVNLQKLYLNHNQLTALPAEIGNLVNLQNLYLNHNQLTALPAEIGNLANLLTLDLNNNLCLFMLDKKLSEFVNVSVGELFKKYNECKHYNAKSSFAKFCQLIHNQEDKNRLKEIFSQLSSAEQKKIRSKIENIFVELPGNQNIENKELLKSQALMAVFDVRRDILSRVILDYLNETFISFTSEQKCIVFQHVWSLAGKPEGNIDWGEKNAEDNIIRLIDATVLAYNAEE